MKRVKLNQLMWRSLLRVFAVALPLAVLAVWAGQTASVLAMKRAVVASNRAQLRSALMKVSDRKMLDKAWKAVGMLPADVDLTDEQVDRLLHKVEADEIHVCDTNGVIVWTSVPEYLGLDLKKHRQTLPFCDLLKGKKEYAQEFGPIAYDTHRYRKYVGVALKRGGLLQLGFNEDRYLPEPDLEWARIIPVVTIAGIVIVLFLIVLACEYHFFRKRIIVPIHRANASLARIASGKLDEKVLPGGSAEMDALADDINVTVDRLRDYIAEAEHRADAEMAMAKAIQANVLPATFPPYPELVDTIDIFARMITAKDVGGDFYDFFFVGRDRLALIIADVSGKGVPAALFMMRAKATLQGYLKGGHEIVEAVEKTNHRLATRNDANMFVTAWIGIVDLTTGELVYVNAGHNPPLLKRADGSIEYLMVKSGPPLAVMDEMHFRRQTVTLGPDDGVVLYTDGVTEATNPKMELYGEERLQNTLKNLLGARDAQTILSGIVDSVDDFVDGAEQADDITLLGFKLRQMRRARAIVTL